MEPTEKPKKPRLRYANALQPAVAAAVNGLYRFRNEEMALARLNRLREDFTIATEQEEDPKSAILWVRNFELTEADEQAGYLGHYAVIRCERMQDEDEHFTLTATKLDRPLKNHPLRKRPTSRCPNWGHPILRGILKNKHYPTLEAALQEFEQLHLEYPETTVPAQNKLYLMIFSRRDNPKQPIEKYVFEIKNVHGGGFTIESAKNTYKPKTERKLPEQANAVAGAGIEGDAIAAPAEPIGHFASMIALKRNKKRK